MKLDPREPPRVASIVAAAWLVLVTLAQSDAGVPFPVFLSIIASGVLLFSWWAARLAWAMLLAWRADAGIGIGWRSVPTWGIVPVAIMLGGAAGASFLPLTLRVRLSADAMTRAAPGLEAVPPEALRSAGARVGLFRVYELSRFDSEIRFITGECGLVDSCGVVFSPDGPPRRHGEDSFRHLYGPWWRLYRSW